MHPPTEGLRATPARRIARRLPLLVALAGPVGLFGERVSGGWIPPLTALAQLAPLIGLVSLIGAVAMAAARRRGDAVWLGAGALLLAPATFAPTAGELGRRWTSEPGFAGPSLSDGATRAPGTLRVLTANLGAGRSDGVEVGRVLRELAADVVCLQEVGAHHVPALEALRDLYPHQVVEARGIQGLGLLSRLPLEDEEVLASPRGRPAIRAIVVDGARRARVLTAHPSAWVACLGRLDPDARHLARLADDWVAARRPGEAALLCGDLNTTDRSWLHRRLRGAGLTDAWHARGVGAGLSWPLFLRWRGVPAPPLVRIDHVLVSAELEPLAIELAPDVGSDHIPVVCELRWVEPR